MTVHTIMVCDVCACRVRDGKLTSVSVGDVVFDVGTCCEYKPFRVPKRPEVDVTVTIRQGAA